MQKFLRGLFFVVTATLQAQQVYTFRDSHRTQNYLRTSDLYAPSAPGRADAASVARGLRSAGWQGTRLAPYGKGGWLAEGGTSPVRPEFAAPVFLDLSELPSNVRRNLGQVTPRAQDQRNAVRLM